MCEIRAVSVAEYFDSVRELAALHWQENAARFSDRPPELAVDVYAAAEAAGTALAFAAFDGADMVGYVSGFVTRHMHFDFVVAQHDVLFVRPDCRNGLGLRLMRRFEQAAKERGARYVFYNAKPDTALADILARRADLEDLVFRKDL